MFSHSTQLCAAPGGTDDLRLSTRDCFGAEHSVSTAMYIHATLSATEELGRKDGRRVPHRSSQATPALFFRTPKTRGLDESCQNLRLLESRGAL
jgi:hypothetical protein